MSFNSYLKEKIDLKNFLEKIIKSEGTPFLIHNVNHDDGDYELEFFDINIEGLDECISKVYERQDEQKDPEKFKQTIIRIK